MRKDLQQYVNEGSDWYIGDQFAQQYRNSGPRSVIENRWKIFKDIIDNWSKAQSDNVKLCMLDVGCGDGINLYGLRRIISQCELNIDIYGLDYNALRLLRAQEVGGITGLIEGSIVDIPISSECIDIVLCNHVIEHVPDVMSALEQLYRILKPGGLAIIGVPNEGCLLANIRNYVVQPSISKTTDHVHFFVKESLTTHLLKTGFVVDKINTESFFMPHMLLNSMLGAKSGGRYLLNGLCRVIPSQAAGLIAVARRL